MLINQIKLYVVGWLVGVALKCEDNCMISKRTWSNRAGKTRTYNTNWSVQHVRNQRFSRKSEKCRRNCSSNSMRISIELARWTNNLKNLIILGNSSSISRISLVWRARNLKLRDSKQLRNCKLIETSAKMNLLNSTRILTSKKHELFNLK